MCLVLCVRRAVMQIESLLLTLCVVVWRMQVSCLPTDLNSVGWSQGEHFEPYVDDKRITSSTSTAYWYG
jgi:hypothetical protein